MDEVDEVHVIENLLDAIVPLACEHVPAIAQGCALAEYYRFEPLWVYVPRLVREPMQHGQEPDRGYRKYTEWLKKRKDWGTAKPYMMRLSTLARHYKNGVSCILAVCAGRRLRLQAKHRVCSFQARIRRTI